MNKKHTAIGVSVLALVLAGIGSSVYYSGKLDQNASSKHQGTQEVVSALQGNLTNKDLENEQSYKIPESDKKSKDYVSSGSASEVGQFTISPQGIKTTLLLNKTTNINVSNGPIKYNISQMQLFSNETKTEGAITAAQMALNTRDINGEFITMQVSYSVENETDKHVVTDGIRAAGFTNGKTVSLSGGLDNDYTLAATGLNPGEKKQTYVLLLVPKDLLKNINHVDLQFASVSDSENGSKIVNDSDQQAVDF